MVPKLPGGRIPIESALLETSTSKPVQFIHQMLPLSTAAKLIQAR
jgi:hypothetical protein